MIGRWKLEVERERKITDADALTRIFHTLSAGSGDPAYRDWPGGVVGRVPPRGGVAPIQSVCEISGLGNFSGQLATGDDQIFRNIELVWRSNLPKAEN